MAYQAALFSGPNRPVPDDQPWARIAALFATGHKQAQGPNNIPPDDVACLVIVLSRVKLSICRTYSAGPHALTP
jgi:hypothetical protein